MASNADDNIMRCTCGGWVYKGLICSTCDKFEETND